MRLLSFRDRSGTTRVAGYVDGIPRDITDLAGLLDTDQPGDPADPPDSTGRGTAPVGWNAGHSPLRRLLRRGLDPGSLMTLARRAPAADVVTVLPAVPDPGKIVAAPVNYRDHQQEMTSAAAIESMGVFLKAPSSVLGHGGAVRLPYTDRRFDQEGELGVVIGRTASGVAESDALDCVAGYTCLLDMTMRGGEDRSLRKSFDTFTPIGPTLVTADEVGPLADLELHTWVDGVLRQRADIADLIWGVPRLVSYASSVMRLEPGDVIATGTPAGVGPVRGGQRVAVEITRIGRLEVTVEDSAAVTCPTTGRDSGPPPPETVTRPSERR